MKNLQMPHSYISVSEEELRSISGGGPLGERLGHFYRIFSSAICVWTIFSLAAD